MIELELATYSVPVSGSYAWLCQTAGTPAPAAVATITPLCPSPGGEVSGILRAANVIGPAGQGVNAGELADLIGAIRRGLAYVNVHTSVAPGGEIRSQGAGGGDHRH